MFNRVLVTGGAGFIGSHLVDLLVEKGYKVRVFDSLDTQVHGETDTLPDYLNKEAEFIRGNVLDRDALKKAMQGCDAVVHDAAQVGVAQSQYEISRYTSVNVGGTAQVLDLIVNECKHVQRLVVASSMSIYGEGVYKRPSDGKLVYPTPRPEEQMARRDWDPRDPETGENLIAVPTPETKPLHCTSIYALNKKDQEEYVLCMGRIHGLSTVACRFFNVYGPRQSLSNPYTGATAIFLSRIKNGHSPLLYEDGKQMRDFIHVRDIVEAKQFLLENPKAVNDMYNICTGKGTSIGEISEMLSKVLGRPEIKPEVIGKYRAGDIRHCYGDGSKLAALGWKNRISLEDGLKMLIEWSKTAESVDMVTKAHSELVEKGLVR